MAAGLLSAPPFAPATAPGRLRLLAWLGLACALLTLAAHALAPAMRMDADADEAMRRTEAGMAEIRAMRLELGVPVDPALDPDGTGLIGADYTDLTTTLGDLRAKQTSLNPQFAGLITAWLKRAGVGPGDRVAVSLSGSFPALNLAVLCACDALGLDALVISSVGASTYGANIPGLTWLDMETRLARAGLVRSGTAMASLGGIMDTEGGLDGTGIEEGEAAIARNGATYLREGTPRTVIRDVERRMYLYTEAGPPKAFVNVGGNVTSLGWVSQAAMLDNGLLARVPPCSSPQRGVIFRMFEAGVPVIHLINIERLAAANHLRVGPTATRAAWGTDASTDMAAARRGHLWRLGVLLAVWLALGAILSRRESADREP